MAEFKRLKMGLLGYGPFGENLARTALNTLRADITMVWTRSKGTAEKIRGDGFCATNDVDECIYSPDVEAVIVASPNMLHKEHILKVCDAKKHLWAEKPIVLSLDDYDEILAAVEKAGIVNHCNFGRRYRGAYKAMAQLADAGEFGEPLHFIDRNSRPVGLFSLGTPHKAVITPELSGGWTIHHMIHAVDFAVRLVKQKIVKVYGQFTKSAPDCPSEEAIAAILTTEKGAIIELSDGLGTLPTEYLMFMGTKGMACTDSMKYLEFRGHDPEVSDNYGQGGKNMRFTPAFYGDDAMQGFIAAIKNIEPDTIYPVPIVPIKEGRHALEIGLAIKKSAETNSIIEL
jgi:predicted dehydrogenase